VVLPTLCAISAVRRRVLDRIFPTARTWLRLRLVCVRLLVSRLKVSCRNRAVTQNETRGCFYCSRFHWLFLFLSLFFEPKQIGPATLLTFSVHSIYGYTDTVVVLRVASISISGYTAPAIKTTCLFSYFSWLYSVQGAYTVRVYDHF